jgi:hypothetical protein
VPDARRDSPALCAGASQFRRPAHPRLLLQAPTACHDHGISLKELLPREAHAHVSHFACAFWCGVQDRLGTGGLDAQ